MYTLHNNIHQVLIIKCFHTCMTHTYIGRRSPCLDHCGANEVWAILPYSLAQVLALVIISCYKAEINS